MVLFVEYPKCSTCLKAKKWLIENGIEFEDRNIKEENPTYDELKKWSDLGKIPVKKLFNTSGNLYKSMGLKDRLSSMTDDEMLKLLATDGMLVKRPIIAGDSFALSGFKPEIWSEKLI